MKHDRQPACFAFFRFGGSDWRRCVAGCRPFDFADGRPAPLASTLRRSASMRLITLAGSRAVLVAHRWPERGREDRSEPEDGEVSRHGCERHSGRESDGVDAGKALSFTPVRESSEESRFSSAPSITGRGVRPMCDYSLHHVATRPAKIEDKLVTTKFNNSITRGFAAVGEPNVAVCLLPGTEIAFDENVEGEPSFGIGILPNKKTGQRLARFRQVNMENAVAHHDALEFPDGQVVLLTRLCEGQRATVLQLPAAPRTPQEAEEQRRVAVVA